MYHDITAEATRGGGGPARFAVPLPEFRRQLDQLRAEGYAGCALGAALRQDADRAIAITFDDGDTGQVERGYRALVERGMTATFFVTTSWIGRPGYASWSALREMRAAGMEVQSHSHTHPFLSELDGGTLETELRESKRLLDEQLGQATDMLALPGGDWPRRSLRPLIAGAGYRVVATSQWGTNRTPSTATGPVVVRRCTVQGVAGADHFRRVAAGDAALGRTRRLRESTLGTLRSALGPTRYARWRRAVLDVIG
jgi:peptidoglycan/xylan/chitin deacetylase (PgdA/CDA1 family)